MDGGRECLVEKRDGRVEGLRATKIARSVLRALEVSGRADPHAPFAVAAAVLARLGARQRRRVRSAEIAETVSRVLRGAGCGRAADAYAAAALARHRRRSLLQGGA